jgi:hypothetical protein
MQLLSIGWYRCVGRESDSIYVGKTKADDIPTQSEAVGVIYHWAILYNLINSKHMVLFDMVNGKMSKRLPLAMCDSSGIDTTSTSVDEGTYHIGKTISEPLNYECIKCQE